MAFNCWSLVKDLQETPLTTAVLAFLSKFIIVIVLDIMHNIFPLRGLHFQMVLYTLTKSELPDTYLYVKIVN